MKVPDNLVIPKKILTPRTGILEQQGPDRDPVIYCRDITFGGCIHYRRMVKDRENVRTKIQRCDILMTLSTGCSSINVMQRLQSRF